MEASRERHIADQVSRFFTEAAFRVLAPAISEGSPGTPNDAGEAFTSLSPLSEGEDHV